MTREILRILASPRFLLGLALLGAVVLCLAACGPGADRTPKKAESQPMKTLAESPLNARIEGGRIFSGGTMPHIVFREGGTFSITASREKPLYSIDFDGGKWCDVYADARGLHWKDCKTGEEFPRRLESTLIFTLLDIAPRLDRIEARLKKLENPPPTSSLRLPIEDVPHYAPCGEGRSSNIVDAKTGKPLCRVDANKGGKPHDGEVRSNGRCDETAGQEIYSAPLDQWLCVNAPMPTSPWPGDKAPPPADHRMPGKGGKP